MTGVFYTFFLAVVWLLVSGEFSAANILTGLVVGFCTVLFSQQTFKDFPERRIPFFFQRVFEITRFVAYVLWQILVSNLRVAATVIGLRKIQPAVVHLELDGLNDMQTLILANVITLTPGTLSIEADPDGTGLYVHVMEMDDVDSFKTEIEEGFIRRIRRLG